MFPRAAVFQSATPADRTSYRSSLGVVRARAARACVLVWQDAPRALPKRFPAKARTNEDPSRGF